MAEKKKKSKWKRRIKKALKLAALGTLGYGAAKMFGGRKRLRATDSPGNEFAKARASMTDLPDYNPPKKADWITKKSADVVEPAVTLRKPPIGRMRGVGTDAEAIAGQDLRALHAVKANAPKGIMHPVYGQPHKVYPGTGGRGFNRAKGGRIGAKKGGRVTGIAKRGFGRALMKGKK